MNKETPNVNEDTILYSQPTEPDSSFNLHVRHHMTHPKQAQKTMNDNKIIVLNYKILRGCFTEQLMNKTTIFLWDQNQEI